RALVGGAAVTEEFAPGFRNSTAAYTVSLLNPKVIRELRLAEHGLRIVERPFANFLPLPDGRCFRLGPTTADTQKELSRFSRRDAERLPDYYRTIEEAADTLRALVLETPPNLGMSWRSGLRALALGGRRNGRGERREREGSARARRGDHDRSRSARGAGKRRPCRRCHARRRNRARGEGRRGSGEPEVALPQDARARRARRRVPLADR